MFVLRGQPASQQDAQQTRRERQSLHIKMREIKLYLKWISNLHMLNGNLFQLGQLRP